MPLVLGFAFLAGVLTILAPCTLPVVPFVFGATARAGRWRVASVFAGFGATFVFVTVLLAAVLAAAGLTTALLRIGSAIILGIVGASLALPILGQRIELVATPLGRLGARAAPFGMAEGSVGLLGGFVLGASIGLIWAPCVGPIMAAVIAIAVSNGPTLATTAIAFAYVAGASLPLLAIATLGRRSMTSTGWTRRLRPGRVVGSLMVVAAVLVISGRDVPVENGVATILPPGWGTALTGIEQVAIAQQEPVVTSSSGSASPQTAGGTTSTPSLPTPLAPTLPALVNLNDHGPAADFTGITAWLNSPPLTIGALRGKVVLVEFWTFACINCIHVQPYVKAWSERYGASGLVVVGVHSPELSFERDFGNVRDAVTTAGLTYPIAFDPAFATWNAYHNSYWPALYFIDRSGRIRHLHIGEGDYDGSEQVLRQLLSEAD